MLAYPQRGVRVPLEGIAPMEQPGERLGRAVATAARLGADLMEQTRAVSSAGELAAFAGRLREIETATRAELEELPVRDWDYAWAQASTPRLREALEELPPQTREAAQRLALHYDAQASLAARRDYELARIGKARRQWQERVEESVAAGDADAAEQWIAAGKQLFVPKSELKSECAAARSRSVLQRWKTALEQDAVAALSSLQRQEAELPTEPEDLCRLQRLQAETRQKVCSALAEEVDRDIAAGVSIAPRVYEQAAAAGLISESRRRQADGPVNSLSVPQRCEWLQRIDNSAPEEQAEVLLDIASEPLMPFDRKLLRQRLLSCREVPQEARRAMSRQLRQMYLSGQFGCPGDTEALTRWGRLQEQSLEVLRRHPDPEAQMRWLQSQKPAPEAWICTTPETH